MTVPEMIAVHQRLRWIPPADDGDRSIELLYLTLDGKVGYKVWMDDADEDPQHFHTMDLVALERLIELGCYDIE